MIDVREHFYDDDPSRGHPDVRTKLKDASYFFLGNGHIQAALQVAPSGEGTAVGLLLMNPEFLGKKREALTMDPDSGLEDTLLRLGTEGVFETAAARSLKAQWADKNRVPAVRIQWTAEGLRVSELFYCPDLRRPVLVREAWIKNVKKQTIRLQLKTGVRGEYVRQELEVKPGGEVRVCFEYKLDRSKKKVGVRTFPEIESSLDAQQYWQKTASCSFGHRILDHYFNASRFQLPAVISRKGKLDGSVWQYNREWVRDQAMVAVGLVVSGHFEIARKILHRLLKDFVTEEGDTVDSSERRHPDDVELDQNGFLLHALKHYVFWTADLEVLKNNWKKIVSCAEFPLKKIFRHSSGLLANKREFWERHHAHGVLKGMELAHQLFTSIGLSAAAELARLVSEEKKASEWEREAKKIRQAMLNDQRFSLVSGSEFIKRRSLDGSVQEFIEPLAKSRLPRGVPLASGGIHRLNPDTSAALPIANSFVPAGSPLALKTLASLETLWNQAWEGGGYGRYHLSSEPDSPGAWPFPSLFIARAYAETGNMDNVWRILNWLNTLPGARAGSWFEFYGERQAPPFPQVGITPWTWAEMLILLVHHLLGVRPEAGRLRIKPRLLPGVKHVRCSFRLREGRLDLQLRKGKGKSLSLLSSNCPGSESSEQELLIPFSRKEIRVEVSV